LFAVVPCGEPNSNCASSQLATVAGASVGASLFVVIALILLVVIVIRRRRNAPTSSAVIDREDEQTFAAVIGHLETKTPSSSPKKSSKVWDSKTGFANPDFAVDAEEPEFELDHNHRVVVKNPVYGQTKSSLVPPIHRTSQNKNPADSRRAVVRNPLFQADPQDEDDTGFDPNEYIEFDPSEYIEFDPAHFTPAPKPPVTRDLGYFEVAPKTLQRPRSSGQFK
jgi:hypothetical protein